MPDTISQASFNGVFRDAAGNEGSFTGSFNVDYTTGVVTGADTINPGSGSQRPNGGGPLNGAILVNNGNGSYTITSQMDSFGGTFTINYMGQYPSSGMFSYALNGDLYSTGFNPSGQQSQPISSFAVCFAENTAIASASGLIQVERLRVGDTILTLHGINRAVKWLGHRTIDCARHPRPHEVMPIRISAHAFAENRPSRDLRVSPGHAICVDVVGEVLIPAAALVNGTTIVQEHVDSITYWHVELEGGHDIILAENLPCESYIEMGNRSFFAEAETTALHASPDTRIITHADFCRPFHQDGPVVAFVRERLAARSPSLGWTLKEEPFANLHLLVDGLRVQAETNGLTARFLVPACAKEVWLCSDTSVPAEIGLSPDLRSLGVCIGSITIDDGFGSPRAILADHPYLSVGFHNIEEGPQRWTAGRSRLPAELWEGCHGSFFLRVELTRPALPRWGKPVAVREDLKKLTG